MLFRKKFEDLETKIKEKSILKEQTLEVYLRYLFRGSNIKKTEDDIYGKTF